MPSAIAGLGWWRARGVAATPGYSLFDFALGSSHYSQTGSTWLRAQFSTMLGGGEWYNGNTPAQNDVYSDNYWLSAGTYKVASVYRTNSGDGIDTVAADGTSWGTIDHYSASGTSNVYGEITGISVTAGLKNITHKAATKNASSSGYQLQMFTNAYIRTGA